MDTVPRSEDDNVERDIQEWLPLDTARTAFTLLATGPEPLSLDGCAIPGLPQQAIPLDELRDRLLDEDCPTKVRDAVWRTLIRRSRRHGARWTVACVGMALPGLAGTARWLAARYRGDRADIHASVLTGFIQALTSVDLRDPGVSHRLQWHARRAGTAALTESLSAPLPTDTVFDSMVPRTPYGHPDLVLARAVGEGVLTPTEADLISATRLGSESVTEWAHSHHQSVHAVAKARERAEQRVKVYLTDPDQAASEDPSGRDTDPVAAAAVQPIRPVVPPAETTPATSGTSRTVSGRLRNGRPAMPESSKKSARLVSKRTPKSGLLSRGDATPSSPRSAKGEPNSEDHRCA